MSLGKKIRGGFAALLSASLILSGALLVTPAASAVEATPVVSTSVSGVVDETSLSFAVSASGLPGDVSNLYAALVVKGTDPGLGYTAFALRDTTYLLASWHASTRPATLLLDDTPAQKWIGLQIRSHQVLDAGHATVEFLARYRIGGRAQRLHETSRFVREGEYWFYVNGDIHD